MKRYIHMLAVFMVLLLGGCQNKTYVSPDDSSVAETIQSTVADPVSVQNSEQKPSEGELSEREKAEALEVPETSVQAQDVAQMNPEPSKGVSQKDRKTGSTVNYRYLNGIECHMEAVDIVGDETVNLETLRIDGLRDIQVQQQINDRIKQGVLELYHKDYPPYRGIKKLLADDESNMQSLYVGVYVYYNESNLLSIGLSRSFYIKGYTYYCEETTPLTFDLKTGNELHLADLFYDGCDYQNAIVECVRNGLSKSRINDQRSSFTLLKPFETVKENQKFYISSPAAITLVLDYETPEFDVEGMGSCALDIVAEDLPEGGAELVFTEKYETWDEYLYRSEQGSFKRHKILKTSGIPEKKVWMSDNPVLTGNVYAEVMLDTEVITNVENQRLADMIAEIDGQEEKRLVQVMQEEQIGSDQYGGAYYRFYTSCYGDYLNIIESCSFWGNIDKYRVNSKVYHAATGEQLALSDIFVPGVDYETILINALRRNQDYVDLGAVSEDDGRIDFDNLQFAIYSDELRLVTPDNKFSRYISYEDIGEENLMIFH